MNVNGCKIFIIILDERSHERLFLFKYVAKIKTLRDVQERSGTFKKNIYPLPV